MSPAQAWKQSTLVNEIGPGCGVLSLLVSGVSACFYHRQAQSAEQSVSEAKIQTGIAQRIAHEQRLLEWQRLALESVKNLPDVTATTVEQPGGDSDSIFIRVVYTRNGTANFVSLDTPPFADDLVNLLKLPVGQPVTASVLKTRFHRERLMRLIAKSDSGSIRVKTFYLPADNTFKLLSDTTDHVFDFLIANEPGRENYKPAVTFGFGPPTSAKK